MGGGGEKDTYFHLWVIESGLLQGVEKFVLIWRWEKQTLVTVRLPGLWSSPCLEKGKAVFQMLGSGWFLLCLISLVYTSFQKGLNVSCLLWLYQRAERRRGAFYFWECSAWGICWGRGRKQQPNLTAAPKASAGELCGETWALLSPCTGPNQQERGAGIVLERGRLTVCPASPPWAWLCSQGCSAKEMCCANLNFTPGTSQCLFLPFLYTFCLLDRPKPSAVTKTDGFFCVKRDFCAHQGQVWLLCQ